MRDWHTKADELITRLLTDKNYSWTKLYTDIQDEYPEVKDSAIRGYVRDTDEYKDAHKPECQPVGVIGDLHIPFSHPGYLPFLQDTFKRYNVGQVVSIGDLFDQYTYSRFTKKPLAMSPRQEVKKSREKIKPYIKEFPKLKLCIGNHDTRYIDRAEEYGIDDELLKDFPKIYNLPDTWEIYDEYRKLLIIDDVLYIHGTAYGGKDGAKQAAINEQMSVVMGHSHSYAGIWPIANKRKLMYGLNVGCGIDPPAYAFAYNKADKFRPILSCGIVYSSSFAIWVPMGMEWFRS